MLVGNKPQGKSDRDRRTDSRPTYGEIFLSPFDELLVLFGRVHSSSLILFVCLSNVPRQRRAGHNACKRAALDCASAARGGSASSRSQCLLVEHGKIVSGPLDRAMTFLNCFLRAVEIGQAKAGPTGGDTPLRRLARHSAAGDPRLYDVHG